MDKYKVTTHFQYELIDIKTKEQTGLVVGAVQGFTHKYLWPNNMMPVLTYIEDNIDKRYGTKLKSVTTRFKQATHRVDILEDNEQPELKEHYQLIMLQ